jgi:uncharacterized protein YjeT (DUF2065 family)
MAGDLLTALALILVIEGVAYALFPEGMKRILAQVLALPPASLRNAGLMSAIAGLVLVWLARG